jgi:tetratricopeptide (TPR) repeat protein
MIGLLVVLLAAAGPTGAADRSGYLGNAACATCHSEIAKTFSSHPMARESGHLGPSGLPGVVLPATLDHAPSGVRYTVSSGPGGRILLDYDRGGPKRSLHGRIELTHFVGGTEGYSFLHERDGYLYQAPLTFYFEQGRWGMSPGFEEQPYMTLSRPAQLVCVECHFSTVQPIAGTSNRYEAEPYLQGGVGCERCHGPGAAHRDRITKGVGSGIRIVNPAKLPPDQRDSVCAQCHLQGEARLLKKGCGLGEYRPGDALADVAPVYVWAGAESLLDQTSHYRRLWQSLCHQKSGGKLWCGSCHDPHRAVPAKESGAYFRSRCLACHTATSCKAPAEARNLREDHCTSCHMPRRTNELVAHSTATDHAIPRFADARRPSPPEGLRDLVPFWGGASAPRDLGLAYASLSTDRTPYRERAEELLRRAYGEGARDAQTLIILATLLEAAGAPEKAVPLYREGIAAGGGCADELSVAENRLGFLLAGRGDVAEAVTLFEKALFRVPAYEGARVNLARARAVLGDSAGAQRVFSEGLALEPDSVALHQVLDGAAEGGAP